MVGLVVFLRGRSDSLRRVALYGIATLLIVPYLFAVLRRGNDGKIAHGVFDGDLE